MKYGTASRSVSFFPWRQNFALEIPTCWYILALPNAKICVTPDAKPKICVTPDANPRRQSVEYRWHWAFLGWGWRWACTFHILLIFIVRPRTCKLCFTSCSENVNLSYDTIAKTKKNINKMRFILFSTRPRWVPSRCLPRTQSVFSHKPTCRNHCWT